MEFNQSILLHPHTLCVEWEGLVFYLFLLELSNTLYLNYSTIQHLELLFNIKTQSTKDSLFGILNHTHTNVGKRLLRSFLLTPSADKVSFANIHHF